MRMEHDLTASCLSANHVQTATIQVFKNQHAGNNDSNVDEFKLLKGGQQSDLEISSRSKRMVPWFDEAVVKRPSEIATTE